MGFVVCSTKRKDMLIKQGRFVVVMKLKGYQLVSVKFVILEKLRRLIALAKNINHSCAKQRKKLFKFHEQTVFHYQVKSVDKLQNLKVFKEMIAYENHA